MPMRTSAIQQAVRIAVVGGLALGAAISALIAVAARADFVFRGCDDIPRAEWEATVNCLDGWFAQVLMSGLALGLFVASALVWQRGRPA